MSGPVSMRVSILLLAASLAVPELLAGQSLLGTSGLGFPLEAVDARARALGTEGVGLLGGNLNPTELAQAMELIARIRDKGITIMMIEHVMKAIMNVCERIMVLHHGQKIAEGTPQEIASSETVIKIYLGEKAHAGS